MFFRELDQRKQFFPSLYILKHLHKSQLSKHCNVYIFWFFIFSSQQNSPPIHSHSLRHHQSPHFHRCHICNAMSEFSLTIRESVLTFSMTTIEELFNSTLYVYRQHLLLCFSSICREDLLTGQAQMAGWGYKEQTCQDEMGQNKNWTTKHKNHVSLAADWKVCKKYFRINFLRRRRKSDGR